MAEYRGSYGLVGADARGEQPLANGANTIKLHGAAADVVYGSQTAARLRSWRLRQKEGKWTLTAIVEKADAFLCNQRGLLFTAPRDGCAWAWGIERLEIGKSQQLTAIMGRPEQ